MPESRVPFIDLPKLHRGLSREIHEAVDPLFERAAFVGGDAVSEFERLSGLALAPSQHDAVKQAAQHKVMVITGGPGVGKTTIVRAILALFDATRVKVRLAAPTGRAASDE